MNIYKFYIDHPIGTYVGVEAASLREASKIAADTVRRICSAKNSCIEQVTQTKEKLLYDRRIDED